MTAVMEALAEINRQSAITNRQFKIINPKLRAWLADHIAEDPKARTQGFIGAQLGGISSALVNTYLNDHFMGDAVKFERSLEDYRATVAIKASAQPVIVEFIRTTVVDQVLSTVDLARRTNQVALIVGAAGVGKSEALKWYAKERGLAIYIEIGCGNRNEGGLGRAIAEALGVDKIEEAVAILKRHGAGKSRVLIIDEAQNLSFSGRRLIFSLWSATSIPTILCGNPIIEEIVAGRTEKQKQRLAQHARRIHQKTPIVGNERGAFYTAAQIAQFVAKFFPRANEAFLADCQRLAKGNGYIGNLGNHLALARELRAEYDTDREALVAANRRLVTNIKLA